MEIHFNKCQLYHQGYRPLFRKGAKFYFFPQGGAVYNYENQYHF